MYVFVIELTSIIFLLNKGVDISVLLTFKKLATLTKDASVVVNALNTSELLTVSEDGKKIKRIDTAPDENEVDTRTIFVV